MTTVADDQTSLLLNGSEQVVDFDGLLAELDSQSEQIAQLREGYRSCVGELVNAVAERRALELAHQRAEIRRRIEALGLPEADTQDLAFQLLGS